jgi:ribosome-associated protein
MREQVKQEMLAAIEAAESKKADNLIILEMDKASGAFTDHFIICTGANPRQIQTIADEVELQVKRQTGTYAHQVEGYREGEWVLVDYVDFVMHVFSEERRGFYGLERLWKSARTITLDELQAIPTVEEPRDSDVTAGEQTASKSTKKKTSAKKSRPIKALSTRSASKTASKKAAKESASAVKKTAKKSAKKK